MNKVTLLVLLTFLCACSNVSTQTHTSRNISNTTMGYAVLDGYSRETHEALFEQGRYDRALKLLRQKDININAGDHQGKTLLYEAVRKADLKAIKFLFEEGASANVISHFGTPLQFAAMNYQQKTETTWEHEENKALTIVKILIENGAVVDLTNQYGQTPLMFAVQYNNFLIVKHLLDSGANIKVEDIQGKTVLDIVTEKESYEMKQFLVTYTKTNIE